MLHAYIYIYILYIEILHECDCAIAIRMFRKHGQIIYRYNIYRFPPSIKSIQIMSDVFLAKKHCFATHGCKWAQQNARMGTVQKPICIYTRLLSGRRHRHLHACKETSTKRSNTNLQFATQAFYVSNFLVQSSPNLRIPYVTVEYISIYIYINNYQYNFSCI